MPSPRIRTVILNAPEPAPVVAFWSGFLEASAREADPEAGIVWLEPSEPGGIALGVQTVDHALQPASQVHLDIEVADLAVSTARIEELGGSLQKINRLDNGFEWRVMRDPAGHEFCIFME
ncbi:MAG: VOC family protein [Ilumatobacteraceae bacterium]